jgi:hypothetical protein|uniref:Uncharacterized protein n=1 Tax=Myoviridae sp. ctshb19 TaxID=2825194 RepID=A0A8S5UGX8_9CAUD|nr:MAG TPA: hypothetical protein [Myoviridae sp. ctshb19]
MIYVNDIQWKLAQHAARYFTDIGVLSQAEKIKHFALVVGRICTDYRIEGPGPFSNHGFDLFYYNTMFANYMNTSVGGMETMEENVEAFGMGIDHMLTSVDLIIQMGQFCKIAEATDHMEPMNFRVEVTKVIEALSNIAWRMMRTEGEGANVSQNFEAYMLRKERKMHLFDERGTFNLESDEYLPV